MEMYRDLSGDLGVGKGSVEVPSYIVFDARDGRLLRYVRERGLVPPFQVTKLPQTDGVLVVGDINPCFL